MKNKITVRPYKPSDARFLAEIYYNTIHNVNAKDYSKEQLDAWAPLSSLELDGWQKKWQQNSPIVACYHDNIIGFAEFENNGHIDCFYIHHLWQGRGAGSTLIKEIEKKAREKNISKIFAEVSITAKPFFEKMGFMEVKEQQVNICGVYLTNFIMEKYPSNT